MQESESVNAARYHDAEDQDFIIKVITEDQEELIIDINEKGAIITWTNCKKPQSNKKMKMKYENDRILTIQSNFGSCKHV